MCFLTSWLALVPDPSQVTYAPFPWKQKTPRIPPPSTIYDDAHPISSLNTYCAIIVLISPWCPGISFLVLFSYFATLYSLHPARWVFYFAHVLTLVNWIREGDVMFMSTYMYRVSQYSRMIIRRCKLNLTQRSFPSRTGPGSWPECARRRRRRGRPWTDSWRRHSRCTCRSHRGSSCSGSSRRYGCCRGRRRGHNPHESRSGTREICFWEESEK